MGAGLGLLNRLAGLSALDRLGLRAPLQRTVFQATKSGFRTVGAASRTFEAVRPRPAPVRPAAPGADPGLFDLTPSDDQRMIQQACAEFAAEQLRPAAAAADAACERRPRWQSGPPPSWASAT